MNDLEWLARNVHEWPNNEDGIPSEFIYTSALLSNGYGVGQPGDVFDGNCATKDQWLAERARLQNKPSWDDAPEWAEWLFQNERGTWVWFEKEPKFTKENIDFKGEMSENKGELLGYYRDTLEKKSEQMTPPTHANHRCVQVTIENQEWDGEGLPPAGAECWVETDFHKVKAVVKLYDGDSVVYRPCIGSLYAEKISDCTFMQIQTEEQKAIKEIETMINEWMRKEGGAEQIAKSIYDYCTKNQDAAE